MKPARIFRPSLLLLIALFVSAYGFAQEKTLTPELILSIRTITDAQLSPDGSNIVFQVFRTPHETEKPGTAISEIWMMPTKGGQAYRFTYNDRNDRAPQWSPDGKQIAFLSQRGDAGQYQIYIIRPGGGEAMPLASAENSVSAFKWSPDGSRIAYISTDAKTKEELQAAREGRDWIIADHNYKHARLYTIDLKTKGTKRVLKSDMTVQDFDWSPDGRKFILAATDTPTVDDGFMNRKLMTVSSEGGEPRLLTETKGKLNSPRWSPDGKWIAWLGATAMKDPFAGSAFVIPAAGGAAENLLKGYEGTTTGLDWQPGKPATIVFSSIERQQNAAYTISMADRKREPLLTQAIIHGSSPSFSRDGRWMAISANTPAHPNEIFFGEAANKPLNRLTTFNPQLNGVALGEQEVVKWKSTDGWEIEGVLVKPVGYQRGVRYPTVMQPHGGPEGADMNGWLGSYSRWGQMLAGKGYATFYPNYRGSIGRGVNYSMGDHRDLMGKEFEDMLTGIDHLVKEGITDPNRVGVGGGSYGGYTSAWAATFASERFKASVAWMGISNWYSMTGTSDIFLENSTVHWDAIMYDNYELYLERSPIRHIKKANTPTLIIHGGADPRVPIGQSQELYTALKWKGVPVEFVTYPREGHGVGERAHQLDFMQRVAGWFDKYLKNGAN
ncbi:MAG: S9 family peptidase [Blastocatellia bacterium]|nr:S9 family peptidase [Blastocatellia bacterium]